jgi:FkbM family methyltransferase
MTFISYAQNFEDVMLWRALRNVEKGFYVDVGANDPVLNSVTKAFYERGWRGINIEPVRYWFDKLENDRPEDVNLNIAISDKPGFMRLYDVADTGLSTFSQDVAEAHKETGGFVYQEILVPALTLREVISTSPYNEIHFLNIDVEGAELQVLTGIDLNRIRPWIILVEATRPLSAVLDYENWDSLLTKRDYEFAYFDGLNRFYLAKERGDLQSAFKVPPNVFDDFIRFGEANNLSIQLESALKISKQTQTEMKIRISELENEAVHQRSDVQRWWAEADHWWREADHNRLVLQSVYNSHSWQLTAPLRGFKLKEKIRISILQVVLFIRKIPGVRMLLNAFRRRFPIIWTEFASRVKDPGPVERPAAVPNLFAAFTLADPEDEKHFLGLFQRELSMRKSAKKDME